MGGTKGAGYFTLHYDAEFDVLPLYIVAARDKNIERQGNAVAVFTSQIDLTGLLSDPKVTNALTEAVENVPIPGAEIVTATLSGGIASTLEEFRRLFTDAELMITSKIGVDNDYNYGFGFDLYATSLDEQGGTIDITIEFSLDIFDQLRSTPGRFGVPFGKTALES